MTRGVKVWWVAAVLFSLVNLVAEVFAAARLEVLHACIHALLLLVGVYFVWQLAPWRTVTV
jgi:hypothetical protein